MRNYHHHREHASPSPLSLHCNVQDVGDDGGDFLLRRRHQQQQRVSHFLLRSIFPQLPPPPPPTDGQTDPLGGGPAGGGPPRCVSPLAMREGRKSIPPPAKRLPPAALAAAADAGRIRGGQRLGRPPFEWTARACVHPLRLRGVGGGWAVPSVFPATISCLEGGEEELSPVSPVRARDPERQQQEDRQFLRRPQPSNRSHRVITNEAL